MNIPPPTLEQRAELELLEKLEKAFEACTHPFSQESEWCNICGAMRIGPDHSVWMKPHWRDILGRALLTPRILIT